MWRYPKSNYKCTVLIQHVPTSKYLTIEPHHNNKITLYNEEQVTDASIFNVYERQTPRNNHNQDGLLSSSSTSTSKLNLIIGFQNKCTNLWLGQSSVFGSVVCTARKFGKNEEWEIDDGIMEMTKILCASANWGSGGWLNATGASQRRQGGVDGEDETENVSFTFGGYDAASKKSATLWSVIVLDDDDDDGKKP